MVYVKSTPGMDFYYSLPGLHVNVQTAPAVELLRAEEVLTDSQVFSVCHFLLFRESLEEDGLVNVSYPGLRELLWMISEKRVKREEKRDGIVQRRHSPQRRALECRKNHWTRLKVYRRHCVN